LGIENRAAIGELHQKHRHGEQRQRQHQGGGAAN
jgi:hypothetical protein